MFPSSRNRSVDLQYKSVNWFLCCERLISNGMFCFWLILQSVLVKYIYKNVGIANQMTGFYMERNTELKHVYILSVLRQKGESYLNGGYKKTKHVKFSEKRTFLTPRHAYGGKKCSFLTKIAVHDFLVTSVLRFALLLYYYWWFATMSLIALTF